MRGIHGNGFWSADGRGRFPESCTATALARTQNAVVGGADVSFDAGIVYFFEGLARTADERKKTSFPFGGGYRGKLDIPKIEIGIEKGNAIGVFGILHAELTDDADLGFGVEIGPAKDEFLVGRKLVFGDDAGAVEAEEDGGGVLGKDAAIQIAADEEDGERFGDAASATHNLLGQMRCQGRGRRGPVLAP